MNLKISFSLPPDHSKFWRSSDPLPVICYIPTTGALVFFIFFFMICTKPVVKNNLSSLNKTHTKTAVMFHLTTISNDSIMLKKDDIIFMKS